MYRNLLRLNLQHFAADTGSEGGSEGASTGTETNTTETEKEGEKDIMIPKSRFDEVNTSYKAMKSELDALKEAQTKAEEERQANEQKEAEKKGEFEGLYSKAQSDLKATKEANKAAAARIESLEGVIQGLLDAKLTNIDKEYHDLIPEGMTPEQKLAWVSNAEAKGIFGKRSSNEPLGRQTNPQGNQEVDVDKLNPLQMLASGYGRK